MNCERLQNYYFCPCQLLCFPEQFVQVQYIIFFWKIQFFDNTIPYTCWLWFPNYSTQNLTLGGEGVWGESCFWVCNFWVLFFFRTVRVVMGQNMVSEFLPRVPKPFPPAKQFFQRFRRGRSGVKINSICEVIWKLCMPNYIYGSRNSKGKLNVNFFVSERVRNGFPKRIKEEGLCWRRRKRQIWIITIATDITVITRYFFPKVTTTKKKKVGNNLIFVGIYMCNCVFGEMEYHKSESCIFPRPYFPNCPSIFLGNCTSLSFNRAFNEYMLKTT